MPKDTPSTMPCYSVGIDLGTTNSAVSYFNLGDGQGRGTQQTMLGIPQLLIRNCFWARPPVLDAARVSIW